MKESHKNIFIFFLKSGVIYAVWYVIYEMWVLPDGSLDKWISLNIVEQTAGLLALFDAPVFMYDRVVGLAGNGGIEIVDGCNGIAAMGLFIGFVVAFPGKWINRLIFILFGTLVIYIVNVSRILTLVLTQEYWPQFFSITHDYSTTSIFYMVIFGLWIIWSNYGEKMDMLWKRKEYAV